MKHACFILHQGFLENSKDLVLSMACVIVFITSTARVQM